MRDVAAFERVIRACPAHAHWLEGEAITDIEVMAGVTDRDYRSTPGAGFRSPRLILVVAGRLSLSYPSDTMATMTTVPQPRLLTVEDWMLLEDPPGGRYEILDGVLVVNPSASSNHNRVAEDLADLLRVALRRAGVEATVTIDVEWRVVIGNRIREAPRPDVAVGWVDPATRRLGGPPPQLVVEVWDDWTERYVVRAKRRYWITKNVRWLWELTVGDEASSVRIEVWDLHTDTERPVLDAQGDTAFSTSEPFPVGFRPAEVPGWSEQQALQGEINAARAEEAALQTAQATTRAEEATALAEAATERAERETERAEREAERAERLAQRLRELGEAPSADDSPT